MSPTPSGTPVETTACDDLTGRGAADAELLAERSLEPGTGNDAVWCMLSRSGIPIVSAETGEIVNHPARPTFVDAFVDDVQVPMLADALQDGRTWFLEDIWDLPDYLLPIVGQEFTGPEAMAEAVPGWIADALDNADHRSAFPALVVRALGLAHDHSLDFFAGINPDTFGFDPVQFVIMEASSLSRTGTIEQNGTDADGCARFGRHSDGNAPAATLAARLGESGRIVREAISSNGLTQVAGAVAADLALLAGLDLRLDDNAGGTVRAPTTPGDPDRMVRYQAALRFSAPAAGTTIACGGLRGVRLPDAGPIEGWALGWTLVQDVSLAHPAGAAEAAKLDGSAGGSGSGHAGGNSVFTGGAGHTGLKIVIEPETGCPDQPSCGRGPLRSDLVTAFALIDIKRAPGFERFLPRFEHLSGHTRMLALAWLDAAVHEIDPPSAVDALEVVRHAAPKR